MTSFPADDLTFTESGAAICPRCSDPCHKGRLRTADSGSIILGCAYCLDVDPPPPAINFGRGAISPAERLSYNDVLQIQAGAGLPRGQYYPPGDPRRTQG